MTLRTKYILRILVLVLIATIGVLWYLGKNVTLSRTISEDATEKQTEFGNPEIESLVSIDTDSDGLKDWEEVLWKTDSTRKDTDGDGTDDGKEVAENRDPLKKGPNDIRKDSTVDQPTEKEILEAQRAVSELSTTDRLGRDIFTTYIGLKNTGDPSPEKVAQVVESILVKAEQGGLPTLYTTKDIAISTDTSSAFLKSYGNKVGTYIDMNDIIFSYNELDIFEQALASGAYKTLGQLIAPERAYKAIADGMRSVVVPKEVATTHVNLMNSFYELSEATKNMRQFEQDPTTGMLSAERFQVSYENMGQYALSLVLFFRSRNIIFDVTDGGYALNDL